MRIAIIVALLATGASAQQLRQDFEAGALVIPMDLAYQDRGMFQAYGLVHQLLKSRVRIVWAVDADKTWHHARCDDAQDPCEWDCAVAGSGEKCAYPTASPDFEAAVEVVWDGEGHSPAGTRLSHGYRGGPFVIPVAHVELAAPIIAAWNDPAQRADAPWAERPIEAVVTVHRATEGFRAPVGRTLSASPSLAVFSDGNEDIATSYLRAAGIAQSNGRPFPERKCGADDCGPGTDNPDLLTVPAIMGPMGRCDDPDRDHRNGALFTPEGLPAYCQIMSMHWGVNDREEVVCEGGDLVYHGHEVVAEVREFLTFPTHFFAECQAVNAYENTVPNPHPPHLDDEGRRGHYLTHTGEPPACAGDRDCENDELRRVACVEDGCGEGMDCCLATDPKEAGAGFLIGERMPSTDVRMIAPGIPYAQLDGFFGTVGGSEPSYSLSDFLGTGYHNDLDVTFLTGPEGPGVNDIFMSGFLDGACRLQASEEDPDCEGIGKVSYLGGHRYGTALPLSANPESQGTRLFLNALLEAECATLAGQPEFNVWVEGPMRLASADFPITADFDVVYANAGRAPATDTRLRLILPEAVMGDAEASGGEVVMRGLLWVLGAVGSGFGRPDQPPWNGERAARLTFEAPGRYELRPRVDFRAGLSEGESRGPAFVVEVVAGEDRDGDGVADEMDPEPDDPAVCGDHDRDGCDDCDPDCVPPDAGLPGDAGPIRDAGPARDAGPLPDAHPMAVDAAQITGQIADTGASRDDDGSSESDGGEAAAAASDGCACRAGEAPAPPWGALALLLLAVARLRAPRSR